MKEWWTAEELGSCRLLGLPVSKRGLNKLVRRECWATKKSPLGDPLARKRQGRGGGWEFHLSVLPYTAQEDLKARALRASFAESANPPEITKPEIGDAEAWAAYVRRPASVQAEARLRMRALMQWERMVDEGLTKDTATARLAHELQVTRGTIFAWRRLVKDKRRSDWLPALAPEYKGRTKMADCSSQAWEAFKADYLRLEKPSAKSCYDRVVKASAGHGWTVPAFNTMLRRIERELPAPLITFLREGEKALLRTYPAQQRTRAHFHALQGVNADGHTLDVWVRWPDGEVLRPVVTVIADLYSNAILAYRVDKSESAAAVRLAFYDLFRDWGIPDFALLDNGRAFASKQMTGGQKTRFRFKVSPDETDGVLTALGVKVHWATPYSGQSKPIERSFRDLCDRVAKHPRLAGAYSGNSPMTKPDYARGVQPVDFDIFLPTLDEGIVDHNARPGRRSEVARGRSFGEAFAESYAVSPIRKASAEQLRLAMLASEKVTARAPSGSLHVLGNRYWSEWLSGHVGDRLTARFDPEDLAEPISVYGADGVYLGDAECWEAVGFHSVEAAREHGRKRRAYARHLREAAKIERGMSIDELVALQPAAATPAPQPEAKVVRMLSTRGATALKAQEVPQEEVSGMSQAEVLRLVVSALDRRGEHDF